MQVSAGKKVHFCMKDLKQTPSMVRVPQAICCIKKKGSRLIRDAEGKVGKQEESCRKAGGENCYFLNWVWRYGYGNIKSAEKGKNEGVDDKQVKLLLLYL